MSRTASSSVEQAIRRYVQPGDRVLLGTAAGVAGTLQHELVQQRERLGGLRLVSGMQLGEYEFLDPVLDEAWAYDSWQVMPLVRDAVADGRVGLIPARGALIPELIDFLQPDVFLTVVSPPDSEGMVSLGVSVSYASHAIGAARRRVAEINPGMPRVRGNTLVHVSQFDALVEARHPLPLHEAPPPDDVSARIATHVATLLDEGVTVQIGLGSIPEALVSILAQGDTSRLRLFGMGVGDMIPILERVAEPGGFTGGELLGSAALYAYADDNPFIENYPIEEFMRVPQLASIDRFVSLNGAIQVDLTGQVNSEWAGGRQVSAPGGGFDFVDGAAFSPGGLSIIALRSTARAGSVSTIARSLDPGAPVTVPRHAVQVVVTEHGIADLRGLTLRARREALVAVADPRFQAQLEF